MTLTAPGGTSVTLHDRSGGGAEDIIGTYGVDLNPAEPLDALAGAASAGKWGISIADEAGGDTGSLDGWSMELCGRPVEASTPEMRFRELSREGSGVLLRWWAYPGLQSYRVYRSTEAAVPASFDDVTPEDGDATDTAFLDGSTDPLVFYLVTGVGINGEGPKGHFGE